MTPINTYLIDDEPDAGQLLQSLLSSFAAINVTNIFSDAIKALDTVIMEQPALIFLDIEMPGITGLEFHQQVKKFSPNTIVVFVSAHKNHALEAIHDSIFDFITKPIDREDLRNVVHKIIATKNKREKEYIEKANSRILLKTKEGHHYVSADAILFLEADRNYTNLILKNGKKVLSSVNLGHISEQFPEEQFIRISRKHIINKNYLTFMNFCKKFCIISNNGDEHKLDVTIKLKDLKAKLS